MENKSANVSEVFSEKEAGNESRRSFSLGLLSGDVFSLELIEMALDSNFQRSFAGLLEMKFD